jgi:hypothetical protein
MPVSGPSTATRITNPDICDPAGQIAVVSDESRSEEGSATRPAALPMGRRRLSMKSP